MLNKKAAEFGVITGLCAIGYSAVSYYAGMAWMFSGKSILLSVIIFLTLDIVLTLRLKKLPLETITYGEAFLAVIIYMGVAGLLTTIFGIVLSKVIDTDFPQKSFDASLDFSRSLMEWMGAPPETIEKEMAKVQFDPDNYTYVKMSISYLYKYIWYSIFALIMAIFIKRKPPLFDSRPLDQTSANS